MNCPGCRIEVLHHTNYCGNCGTGLAAATKNSSPQIAGRYRAFLFFIGIIFIAEPLFFRLLYFLLNKIGFHDYNWLRPVNYIFELFFASIPLIVAMLLPKNTSQRNIFFILGIIFVVIRMGYIVWRDFLNYKLPFMFWHF